MPSLSLIGEFFVNLRIRGANHPYGGALPFDRGIVMASMKFSYRSGQRPLDGYTLKRGVGQGAFGEVYFAVSDGGKEVALKMLRGHTDAELRGVSHCLNLKHPNLVHLYDLRTDGRGDHWVVMEYVFGESLASVINKHPTGLPTEVMREWFAALARGVAYLHNQGVVHRDLKPANIFIEHGQVKIGDYGLSRRISGSDGDLSRGVGTPHYMAPEIKNGNYTASIDVYACGIILFEMVCGHRPFDGETPMEVMMKHYIDPPKLNVLPVTYRNVIGRALEKDPAKRYPNVIELAKAVDEMFNGNAKRGVNSSPQPVVPPTPRPNPRSADVETVSSVLPAVLPVAMPVAAPRVTRNKTSPPLQAIPAPLTPRERLTDLAGGFALAPLIAAICTVPWAMFQTSSPWPLLGRVFLLSTVLTWALLLLGRLPKRTEMNAWVRRAIQFGVGLQVGALAFWLDGWALPSDISKSTNQDLVLFGHYITPSLFSTGLQYLFYFGLAVGLCRWWKASCRKRSDRLRIWPILAAAFWGTLFLFLWPGSEVISMLQAVSVLVIAAIGVQAASPWAGPPVEYTSRNRRG